MFPAGRYICDEPIPLPEESYRVCVCVCSWMWSDATITNYALNKYVEESRLRMKEERRVKGNKVITVMIRNSRTTDVCNRKYPFSVLHCSCIATPLITQVPAHKSPHAYVTNTQTQRRFTPCSTPFSSLFYLHISSVFNSWNKSCGQNVGTKNTGCPFYRVSGRVWCDVTADAGFPYDSAAV
jgi:hypothetical protein